MIIILEDNGERQQRMAACLHNNLPPCPLQFFKSAHDMLRYLPDHLSSARLISLDNDLERESVAAFDPGTGRDVANYLVTKTPVCPVVIHSTNLHAAVAMEAELQEAGWQVEPVTPYDDLSWVDREWL